MKSHSAHIFHIGDNRIYRLQEHNFEQLTVDHRVCINEGESYLNRAMGFNNPLVAGADATHSRRQRRYFALGQTDGCRLLFVVFTIRDRLIRVISAREMTKREFRRYRS